MARKKKSYAELGDDLERLLAQVEAKKQAMKEAQDREALKLGRWLLKHTDVTNVEDLRTVFVLLGEALKWLRMCRMPIPNHLRAPKEKPAKTLLPVLTGTGSARSKAVEALAFEESLGYSLRI